MSELTKNKKSLFKKGWGTRLKTQTLMWILLIPTTFALLLKIYPIVSGMVMSFYETKGYSAVRFNGLDNYKAVLTDTMFLLTVKNSFLYVFWSLVIGFLPPLIFAMVLNEMRNFKQTFKFVTYLPAIVPGLAVSMLWTSIYDPGAGGLLNMVLSWLGKPSQQWLANSSLTIPLICISMTWSGYGGSMLLYLAALQNVNRDLYEAAVIDGAPVMTRVFKITLPTIAPTMLLLAVRQVIGLFQIMEQPLVMTDGGPNNASMTVNLASYKMAFEYMQVDRSLALGVVIFFILLVVTFVYFRLDKKLSE